MKTNKNTILIPLDFSDIANHALNHAISVAKHFNNNLALLHVIEEGFLSNLLSFGKNGDELKQDAEKKLTDLANEIKTKHQIECSAHVRVGRIYKIIAETASDLKCDSIIMGSNGASGLEQLIGSNASRVIMNANVPVVVVKSAQTTNNYSNIVFPLDLNIESRQKVSWAIHLGKAYNSTIRILTYQLSDGHENIRMTAALKQIERMLEEKGVKYTQHVLSKLDASFADETLKYAEAINADLIMVMTHQEDLGIGEYIVGTDAQQLVNKSQRIPVMCIKPRPLGYSSEFAI